MNLTNLSVVNAKDRARIHRPYDGHGLYLEVAPSGARRWRTARRQFLVDSPRLTP
jgi:hypothetical protein